jgi:RNA polymerase sigma factor (TIGR02999 family)
LEEPPTASNIAALVIAAESGDSTAKDRLFTALYAELHAMARREAARAGSTGALGVTTLLHETYLHIAGREGTHFPDRARFMGYAARVMRGLVIDHARLRRAAKRGGQFEITTLDTEGGAQLADPRELNEIAEALDALGQRHPSLAELVDLKFFCGFSFDEIATMRSLSERTIRRQWEVARTYLHRHLRGQTPDGGAV